MSNFIKNLKQYKGSYSVINSTENEVDGVDFIKSYVELIGKEVCHG